MRSFIGHFGLMGVLAPPTLNIAGRGCPALYLLLCLALAAPPADDSLRAAAQHSRMLIGTAVRSAQLSETVYAATLAREFNMLEPEDALKWEVLRPDPQSFDFSQADRIVDFAARHDMKVRGHTLVWHRQNPSWLVAANYTPAQLSKLMEAHIKTVVGHFRGRIFAWDVANEAFDEGARSGELRHTIWFDDPGIEVHKPSSDAAQTVSSVRVRSKLEAQSSKLAYLAQCFRWAHEADPQALLFYNEAEAEEMNPKSDAVYAMVRAFKAEGVPIDGVGFEMHISSLHPDIASISANIGRFTALGLQVHITELDVSLPVDASGNAAQEDLAQQADLYRKIAEACIAHPGCTAIQTWGFTDIYSWIGSHSKHTQGAALPFDRDYRPKPSYTALLKVLSSRR